jgi:hypothetical protein
MAEKKEATEQNTFKEWKELLIKETSRIGRVLDKMKLEVSIDTGRVSDLTRRISEKQKQIDTLQLVHDEAVKKLTARCSGG